MQESVQDLQEDSQAKLDQAWEAVTARADECDARAAATRDELLQADSSLMGLLRDVGDAVERLELQDIADLGGRLEELQAAQAEGLAAVEGLVEERAQVRRCCCRCMGCALQRAACGLGRGCSTVEATGCAVLWLQRVARGLGGGGRECTAAATAGTA